MTALRLSLSSLLLAALLPLTSCGTSSNDVEAAAPGSAPINPALGPPVVLGTVVEASSGRPVAGATVLAPDGTEAVSGEDGRFALKGLAVGTTGQLTAQDADGRAGTVRLRPLAGGRLEVVLHLR